MNHRLRHGETPKDRLAVAFKMLMVQFQDRYAKTGHGPTEPDLADVRAFMEPYLERELLLRAIEEIELIQDIKAKRINELVNELYEWEAVIPQENRL